MNKIPQDKLENLAYNTQNLVGTIHESLQWVNSHLKDDDQTDSKVALKKYRRTLNKVKSVVTEKPTVALFGASQVGKSYMANNLLYNKDNKLEVFNHKTQENIDFIKYINPEGKGNEATAPVTRFTSDVISDTQKLPIKVRIFTPRDIVCVLCDTYYSDCQSTKPKIDITQLTEEIRQHKISQTQTVFSDDDIYEIQDYLQEYFKNDSYVADLQHSDFWDVLADNITFIPSHHWCKVLEVLWGKNTQVSHAFQVAIDYLTKLAFSQTVYVDFEAVRRESGESIMNVMTLQKYFEHTHNILFDVQLENGTMQKTSPAHLCFVTVEVVLSVAQSSVENRPFIKDVDIIDFPGARSRPEIHQINEKSILEMLLRGKVSYLFNYYSTNYKANTLSVCMRTQQTNVTTVPRLVNQWIEANLGKTPEEREKNIAQHAIPPLFVIFTWWNTQLEFKIATDNADPSERLEKLFGNRFKEEIKGSYDWNEKWTKEGRNYKRFSNFYLLRDFKESTLIFKRDEQGQTEINSYTNPPQEDFYQNYKKQFIEYHQKNNQFFENPEENFLEASTPSKDGSELIIKNLVPVASNMVSVPIYINVLNGALQDTKTELAKHYHSDSGDAQIQKASVEGSEIQARMNSVFGLDAYYFGSFIEHLTISENEIVGFYHELLQSTKLVRKKDLNKYILFRANSPRLSTDKSFEENLQVLAEDYRRASLEDAKAFFTENEGLDLEELFYGNLHDLQNNSQILADEARNHWITRKLDTNRFSFFIEKGLDKGLLTKLFDNMIVSFDKLKITRHIAQEIRDYVDGPKKIEEARDMMAHITAGKINEFVTSMGWSYYSHNEKQKIRETQASNNLNLRIPTEQEVFEVLEKTVEADAPQMSLEKLIDFMDNLNERLNDRPLDTQTLQYTPMVKNYQRWSELMRISFVTNCDIPTYDIQANQKLGAILDKLKDYSFVL
jgi:hypothetical protein